MDETDELRVYFLAHSYPAALKPFASVMDLPREEADRLTAEFTGKSSDQGSYYEHRRNVETWLRDEAEKAGVTVKNPNPIYFWLSALPYDNTGAGDTTHTISIKLSDIDLSACSFTIGDSFCNHLHTVTGGRHNYDLPPSPFMGRVLAARDAASILDGYRGLAAHPNAYVEVQMWDRLLPAPKNC